MDAGRAEILRIFGRALLWLPACLAAWHFAAPGIAWTSGHAAAPAIALATGGKVAMSLKGGHVVYALELPAPYRPGATAKVLDVDLDVNAAIYSFGVALFVALSLGARDWRRVGAIAAGVAVLALLPGFGIAFDALKQLGATAALAPYLEWPAWKREAVALGYQVGALLLPSLAPVALWAAMSRRHWAPAAETPPAT